MESIVLVVLAEREAAGDVRGLRCVRRGLGEEVVGGEPVVIDKLSNVSEGDFIGNDLSQTLLR